MVMFTFKDQGKPAWFHKNSNQSSRNILLLTRLTSITGTRQTMLTDASKKRSQGFLHLHQCLLPFNRMTANNMNIATEKMDLGRSEVYVLKLKYMCWCCTVTRWVPTPCICNPEETNRKLNVQSKALTELLIVFRRHLCCEVLYSGR